MLTLTQAAVVHGVFEWAALLVGARLYLKSSRLSVRELGASKNFAVIFGCIAGAAIGNKAVHWIYHAERLHELAAHPLLALQGQSLVGGLLGGLIGVEIGKRIVGVTASTGDRFVVPILVGILVGRVGCFLAGLHDDTYGIPTSLPWGIDFGDGVRRHPTQLYEMLYAAIAWWLLSRSRAWLAREPGLAFKLLLSSYLLWRLAIDSLKPVPYVFPGGLSGIQLVCVVALVFYLPLTVRAWRRIRT
jgi:prolipoprotein diacylglyceryltransferase